MAETTDTEQELRPTGGAPVLRPGRPADPVVPEDAAASVGTDAGEPSAAAGGASATLPTPEPTAAAAGAAEEGGSVQGEGEPADSEVYAEQRATDRQRRLRLLLKQCDRVLLMDFNLLAMPDWPDNYTVAQARRRRDIWLFSATVTALVFLSGMTGFVPAWVAGGGFGAFVIILLSGVPFIRRLYSEHASYLELILLRQRLMREARRHIEHLEGPAGLVWQCAQMVEFNHALRSVRFRRLIGLSEKRVLPRYCTQREHIRLFLIYILESEKAYNRLEQAFFDGNQAAIDAGWRDAVAEPEQRA